MATKMIDQIPAEIRAQLKKEFSEEILAEVNKDVEEAERIRLSGVGVKTDWPTPSPEFFDDLISRIK